MDFGGVWRPGECLPTGSGLHIVGEYITHTPLIPTSATKSSDPDYDPIDDIMTRLDDYKHGGEPLVNLSCDCSLTNQKPVKQKKELDDSDSEISSESESDEEDIQLSIILKMLKSLQDKGPLSSPNKAYINIIDSFCCHDNITEEEVNEICTMLHSDNVAVKELTLKLIRQLCTKGDNAELFLNHGLLNLIQIKFMHSQYVQIHTAAVLVLEAIITHYSLKFRWIDYVSLSFIQSLLRKLDSDKPVDYKFAVCCFFKTLVHYDEFVTFVLENVIPVVQSSVDIYSDKLKTVFLDILCEVVKHLELIPPDLIENTILPSTMAVIREGSCVPQSKGLSLLSMLTRTDVGVSAVINNSLPVILVLICINESRCRNVRVTAMEVLSNVSGTRRLGLCKELMAQIASYLCPKQMEDTEIESPRAISRSEVRTPFSHSVPSPRPNTRSEVRTPVHRPMSSMSHYEKESLIWKGLEQLIQNLSKIFCREALVERNDKGDMIHVGYKPCLDSSHTRVGILKQTIVALQNICLWPTSKSRHDVNKIDLTFFTDDPQQKMKLSKLNRYFTQFVWDNVGTVAVDLLHRFSKELNQILQFTDKSKDHSDTIVEESASSQAEGATLKVKGQDMSCDLIKFLVNSKGQVELGSLFEEEEIELIKTLLEFLLCVSLCSCKNFPNLMPNEETKPPIPINKAGKMTRSDSAITRSRPSSAKASTRPGSAIDRPPTGKGSSDGSWVKENPHLTPRFQRFSAVPEKKPDSDAVEDHHSDLIDKEVSTERRLLRKCLYEAGLYSCIGPFISCTDKECQLLALQILRCNIQPLQERVARNAPIKHKTRPQSAMTASNIHEVEKRLNNALNDMSPELSEIIRDALGPQPQPKLELQDSLNVSNMGKENHKPKKKERKHLKPKIDCFRPIATQCRERLLTDCNLLCGIFNSVKDCKKQTLLVIQDLVYFGESSVHQKLSELGCMKKLLDFLRINTDDELLEVTGLIIVQMLLVSDPRVKSTFDRYGGTRFLTSMIQYTSGLLRQEATKTLQTLTKVSDLPKKRIRPKSAPVGRAPTTTNFTPDIWDQIQQRWKAEDKVTEVLQQWAKK